MSGSGLAVVNDATVQDIRIAVGSLAPIVMRCVETEGSLKARQLSSGLIELARATLAREIAPIDDLRSTARYRLRVAQNLLQEFLRTLL